MSGGSNEYNRLVSHLNLPGVLGALRSKELRERYLLQLREMVFPGLKRSRFLMEFVDDTSLFNYQTTEFTGPVDQSGTEMLVGYVKTYHEIARTVPIFSERLPDQIGNLEVYSRIQESLNSMPGFAWQEGELVGGTTSTRDDAALNNGLWYAKHPDADPEVIYPIPDNKGGILYSRNGAVSIEPKQKLLSKFDPGEHILAIGTSVAFDYSPDGSTNDYHRHWQRALEITDSNNYSHSLNYTFAFLAVNKAGKPYYHVVNFDPDYMHRFQLELNAYTRDAATDVIKADQVKVALATRMLLETLEAQGQEVSVAALEENTGTWMRPLTEQDTELYPHFCVYPLELLLIEEDVMTRYKRSQR